MENAVKNAKEHQKKDTDEVELEVWTQDEWVRQWLYLDPSLCSTDLYQYFYFVRESLSEYSTSGTRISPTAQDIIDKLNSKSQAIRVSTIDRLAELSQADITAVFGIFAKKTRDSEDNSGDNSPLRVVLEIAQKRKEVLGEFIELVSQMPYKEVPIWIVHPLKKLCQGSAQQSIIEQLFKHWQEEGGKLKKAVEMVNRKTAEA